MKTFRLVIWMAALVMTAACGKNGRQAETAGTAALSDTIAPGPWRWIGTAGSGAFVPCANPERYTLTFLPDSTAPLLIDCNNGSGRYRVEGHGISVGPFASTRMMCPPGSMDTMFVAQLQSASTWRMNADTLELNLPAASRMKFVR